MGTFAAHIDDIPGCGEPDVLREIRDYLEQHFGELKMRGASIAHVGMELKQEADFSANLTQD